MSRYVYAVARNHARILNHIELIRQKLEVLSEISTNLRSKIAFLLDSTHTDCAASPETVSERVAALLAAKGSAELTRIGEALAPVGLLEFHPTDLCNLACLKCYYTRSESMFPLRSVPAVLRWFSPKGIVLVGGGEPTLYADQQSGAGFTDLVDTIKHCLPSCRIGLITNGVFVPPGNWQRHIDWLRVSVDAATSETYARLKGHDRFAQVIENLLAYLDSPVSHVGAGFLCMAVNIREAPTFLRLMVDKTDRLPSSMTQKLNIQFRPFRHRPRTLAAASAASTGIELCPDSGAVTDVSHELGIMRENPELAEFMDMTSNWERIVDASTVHEDFDQCYRALSFRLLRPDGDVYPCFAHVGNPQYRLGNILERTPETAMATCSLCATHFYNCNASFCLPHLCPLSREKAVCTKYFHGERQSLSDQAQASPFF